MLPQLITAAVVGALSPAAVLSAIMLLGSRRPMLTTVSCLIGWTIALVALGAILQLAFGGHHGASATAAKAAVNLVVGLLLLAVALRTLVGAHHPLSPAAVGERPVAANMPKWMHRLESVRPAQAVAFGALLICASPADVAVFLSAVQALIGEGLSGAETALVFVLLLACIDLCILAPLAVYLLFPRRSAQLLDTGKQWVVAHQRAVAGWSAAVFGVVLIVNSLTSL